MNDTFVWGGLSCVAALTVAGMVLISEYQNQPTVPRLFWLRVISLAVLAPLGFYIQWPSNPHFYIGMVAISVLICGSDALYYDAAKQYGAGATTRIEPLSVLMTFVAWLWLKPEQLALYTQRPAIGLGIAACFVVAGVCALRLRHCDVSLKAMKRLAPVIGISAAVGVLGKMVMDTGDVPFDTAIAYIIIQCSFLIVFYGAMAALWPARTGSLRPHRGLLFSAGAMAVCSVLHIGSKNMAYTYVPNPAYITIICLAAPLIVSAVYRLTGRQDDTDYMAGFGIVASAVALLALTRF